MISRKAEKLAAEAAGEFVRVFGEGSRIPSGNGADGPRKTARVYFAPGRVNLIGEHIDYCGGRVLPCALDMGTCLAVRERSDRELNFYSMNLPEAGIVHTSLDEDRPDRHFGWADYPRGIIFTLQDRGFAPRRGLDMLFYGDIPAGAGLSSSASIEVVTAYALRDLWGFDLDDKDLALTAQESEHTFNGTNCGIMDQFCSALGRADQAVYLDTDTLEYEYVPLELGSAVLLITDSKVKHELAGSAYNDRRTECETALARLREAAQNERPGTSEGASWRPEDSSEDDRGAEKKEISAPRMIRQLCDLTPADFERMKEFIDDPVCRRRAEHVVYENARVKAAAEALQKGDKRRFGELMNESHRSLKDLFEVTVPETDLLCRLAQETEGVYGSRMTGGGFGGSTVTLVEKAAVPELTEHIHDGYLRGTGLEASCYIASAGAGPERIFDV